MRWRPRVRPPCPALWPAGRRPRNLLVFVNPFSGSRRARQVWAFEGAPVFLKAGIKCTVIETMAMVSFGGGRGRGRKTREAERRWPSQTLPRRVGERGECRELRVGPCVPAGLRPRRAPWLLAQASAARPLRSCVSWGLVRPAACCHAAAQDHAYTTLATMKADELAMYQVRGRWCSGHACAQPASICWGGRGGLTQGWSSAPHAPRRAGREPKGASKVVDNCA